MWSYIMSTLTAMLTELSESEQRMRKHLDILREFCRNNDIPRADEKKIRQTILYEYNNSKFAILDVIKDLPRSNKRPIINKVSSE